jgi:hypothetical protein
VLLEKNAGGHARSQAGGQAGGETLSVTAQRLIKWGTSEREALALARVIRIGDDATDACVEHAVIDALVSIKQAADGFADIEYIGGHRRDILRDTLREPLRL